MQFREVFVSPAIPTSPSSRILRLPAATIEKVRQALLGMKSDPAARRSHARGVPMVRTRHRARDYDSVRQVYRLIGQ